MGLFLHKVYRLMSEKGLTYSEACREVGQHAARRRKAIRQRKAGKWIPAKPITLPVRNIAPDYKPGSVPDHNLEQTFLDFN